MYTIIRLDAGHDRNGNPRRCYVIIEARTGDVVSATNEGYRGTGALAYVYPDLMKRPSMRVFNPATFKTTPAEYRSILREFAGKAVL